jgi:cytochrome b561
MNSSSAKFTPVAIGLHWIMAAGLVLAFGVGQYMSGLELSPWKLKIYTWHKWLGVTLFLLVGIRVTWRLTHRPPALPSTMNQRLQKITEAAHRALYVLMVLIPLTGWLHSSAAGVSVVYFNLFPLPNLVPKDKALSHLFETFHQTLNWALLALVLGHVAAALKHQLIDRDHLMARMRP